MTKIEHYLGIIEPVREDFMTNYTEKDEKVMSIHFQYLKDLLAKGKLILAGPALNEKKPFGIMIFKCESLEEAKELLVNDPSVKAGVQNIKTIEPFRLSLYKPE